MQGKGCFARQRVSSHSHNDRFTRCKFCEGAALHSGDIAITKAVMVQTLMRYNFILCSYQHLIDNRDLGTIDVANLVNETAAARRIRLFVFFSKLGRVVDLVVGSRIGSTSIPKSGRIFLA